MHRRLTRASFSTAARMLHDMYARDSIGKETRRDAMSPTSLCACVLGGCGPPESATNYLRPGFMQDKAGELIRRKISRATSAVRRTLCRQGPSVHVIDSLPGWLLAGMYVVVVG